MIPSLPEDVPLPLLREGFEDEDPIKCSRSIIDTVNDTAATLDSCGEFNILPELDVNGEIFWTLMNGIASIILI